MAVSNSLTKANQKIGISAYLSSDAIKAQINNVIGKNSQGFVTAIVSAVNANPDLQECSNKSILAAALLGETLHLSPSPQLGLYYMIPFNNSKTNTPEAQFVLGYKGYIQMAIRSGQYKRLNVIAIKEGELVKYDALNEEIEVNLIEDEDEREKAATVGYFAMFEYVNGFKKSIYWSRKKMEAHAMKYSAGYSKKKGYTYWEKDFDGMAFKTMLRQLISKWGIISTNEMATALDADMAVINEDGTRTYVETEDVFEAPAADVAATEPEKKAEPAEDNSDVAAALFGGENA